MEKNRVIENRSPTSGKPITLVSRFDLAPKNEHQNRFLNDASIMKFLFRADSSNLIGSGHIRRCVTLAQELRSRGAECRFVCRDFPGSSVDLILDSKFEVAVFNGETGLLDRESECDGTEISSGLSASQVSWDADRYQTALAIGDEKFDWLIVDHYGLDSRWESSMRPFCRKIMVIDDLADRKHDCDLLLDQNLVKDFATRYDFLVSNECYQLLGPKYALIHPVYGELQRKTLTKNGPVKHLLVSFGGTDNANLTGKVIQAFTELNVDGTSMDVVLSPDTPYFKTVAAQVQEATNVKLLEKLPSLASAMVSADFAIGASGITTWERCCLGLPSLVITIAENQHAIARELSKRGLLQWAGDSRDITVDAIKQQLSHAFKTKNFEECSRALREVTDGFGVHRVGTLLYLSERSKLHPRLATIADEGLLLRWVNDPAVRENSFCSDVVTIEAHHEWFLKRIKDHNRYRIYMICDEVGTPVGQVRFELTDEGWKIGYSLAGIARGKYLGHVVLSVAIDALCSSENDPLIYGDVKAGNLPSRRVFEKLAFIMKENKQTGVITYWNRRAV
jgi:UDP-2,4-diacetamido-2,4,6-trideoxy-beta-L-altropyranose hydrolase